jgi:hypothetical protein
MRNRDVTINIQFRLPRWGWRSWTAALIALSILGGAAVYANVMWTPFNAGEKLSSAKLNGDLKAIADAVDAVTAQVGQIKPTPPTPQPHLVLNKGNVDLGIYLGSGPGGSGAVVMLPAIKAPFLINGSIGDLRFTGPNCTGTPYAYYPGDAPQPFSNSASDSIAGTIFQITGPPQNLNDVSTINGNNGCQVGGGQVDANAIPLKDTKVPNLGAINLSQTSIQMM